MAWRDRNYIAPLTEVTAPFTVEQALNDRLRAMQEELVNAVELYGWDVDAVDRILAVGGFPSMTREYIVSFEERVTKEVRVRAMSSTDASTKVTREEGTHLLGVREAT